MSITLLHPTHTIKGGVFLTSSKSESNRALIIHALCDDEFTINNLSHSDDTIVLQKLLNSSKKELNVGLAGTTMRFLTAFFAIRKGEIVLTGSKRMKERPIKVLVNALNQLGADIEYLEKEGYPPLKIVGKDIKGGRITIDGSISSQYISALLMIGPKLKNGLHITFNREIISKPYVEMTLKMMRHFGVLANWKEKTLIIEQGIYKSRNITIEADWSAASYWYSFVALAKEADITLYGLKKESLQGDAIVSEIYKNFGVRTSFIENGIRLTKEIGYKKQDSELDMNFIDCPDIAQTVAVTCSALNIKAKLVGLKTLRIKETDRILAVQTELNKLGYNVKVTDNDILVLLSKVKKNKLKHSLTQKNKISEHCNLKPIQTYNDHRMAMAFTQLALIFPITIENENVVTKSYPNFWKDMKIVGFENDKIAK